MEHLLNAQVKQLQISGIRQFFNMVGDYEDVVSLTIGQPDFQTPERVKSAAITSIEENKTAYTMNAGIPELRQAIAEDVKKYGLHYDADSEIIVTVGASEAIDISLRTILSPGDEVLLPSPVYPGYEPLIKMAGASPVHVDIAPYDFVLTKDAIESHITDRTKAVIMPYPSNPTGVSPSFGQLEEIARFMQNKEMFVIADEIYSELVYKNPHTSLASFLGLKDKVVVINGVSKSFSMTGFRIGYVLAPDWMRQHMLKVHQYNVSCASSVSQHAALEALKNNQTEIERMRATYEKRRAFVLEKLKDIGLSFVEPDGAFYVFIQFPSAKSTFETAVGLVEKSGIALVPGSAFSEGGEGYMRLSYAYDLPTLEKGLERLRDYVEHHL
ncbi:aromatic amino acid aminotransferase [Salimicrobium jeotgali]|uniref:Aminotransferase n=1 Tax=Salimicrobium jeotgali TaxID=1230341 RepID=K2GBX2_9BACI|nr:aminotransferase class I/II-fold pyridoxal phosphate-dependent enzyme [Salimicrobium jeotgali]AKG04712.1 aromatic amino acid aminotransferase [Salimicrobium jeotgali]EKE31787.1 aminotransferase A [Salimicrobium jeotgali]